MKLNTADDKLDLNFIRCGSPTRGPHVKLFGAIGSLRGLFGAEVVEVLEPGQLSKFQTEWTVGSYGIRHNPVTVEEPTEELEPESKPIQIKGRPFIKAPVTPVKGQRIFKKASRPTEKQPFIKKGNSLPKPPTGLKQDPKRYQFWLEDTPERSEVADLLDRMQRKLARPETVPGKKVRR
jgi:hypothetical protein